MITALAMEDSEPRSTASPNQGSDDRRTRYLLLSDESVSAHGRNRA
jgi:hypothetical protein